MSGRWMIRRDGDALLLARPGAGRLDIAVETRFPPLRPTVLAHEIRKDLWRRLQHLRGFSPVVRIEPAPQGLRVVAGGQMNVRHWPRENTLTEIESLLSTPAKRARWIAHARLR